MDYKIKETVTRSVVENELRKENFSGLFGGVICTAVVAGLYILMYKLDFRPKYSPAGALMELIIPIFLYILLLIFTVFSVVFTGYFLYCTIRPRKYTVLVSNFVGIHYRYFLTYNDDGYCYYMKFDRFPPFSISRRKVYYKWAKHYSVLGQNLQNTVQRDDDFYIVVMGKFIRQVYNKKTFELSDDLKQQFLKNIPSKGDATNEQ